MANKGDILSATHYGLDIYAHILHEYYPDECVLHLVGRDCGLCRNPFANGEANLHVWIEKSNPEDVLSDELACHRDTSGTIPDGDAFTFAEQYYNLTGDALLAKLEEALHLRHNDTSTDNENPFTEPTFSFFRAPVTNTTPYKSITLFDAYIYIIGGYAKKRTAELRAITDKAQARRFKASCFDYCCFSGTFSKRTEASLIEHSGLMCIDFDHLPDLEGLRQQLLFDEYFETQLMFRSPSGDGLKWVITVDITEYTHSVYFEAVSNYIQQTYDIQIDKSGRDVCRACFLPHDPNAYINSKILINNEREQIQTSRMAARPRGIKQQKHE